MGRQGLFYETISFSSEPGKFRRFREFESIMFAFTFLEHREHVVIGVSD